MKKLLTRCPEEILERSTKQIPELAVYTADSVTASSNSKLSIQASNLPTVFSHQLTKRDANPLSTVSLLQPANFNHQPTIGSPFFNYSSVFNQLLVTNRMGNSPLLKRDTNQQPTRLGMHIQARSFESATLFKSKLVASQSTKDATTSIFYHPLQSSACTPAVRHQSSKGLSYHQPATKIGTIYLNQP